MYVHSTNRAQKERNIFSVYLQRMNNPPSIRTQRSGRNRQYGKRTMYLKPDGKYYSLSWWDWFWENELQTVYIIYYLELENEVKDVMGPEDFVPGISVHISSKCEGDICVCAR